ncbi:Chromate resistance protein ChrB [Metabacillus herbersteinensis]|jgi:hypothetical protein|uniref:Chromate resistance protein ChrB n=1 Tax=Metabacillus herbersteinensis TaxID=283816 RepID=A0ABV6GJR3_9BACI
MKRLWLLLLYKVPPEPTSHRVYVWRKLKRLGAVLLHDTVWCLPITGWTREQFQWLSVEIKEFGGSVMVFESELILPGQDETLIQQFLTEVNIGYTEILKESEMVVARLGLNFIWRNGCKPYSTYLAHV